MFDNLPVEISSNILQRLPVKTLIKCTTLSKSFLSFITSHEFILAHIANNKNTQFLLRYFTENKEERYHFEPDDDNFSGFQTDGLLRPFENYVGDWFNVLGCVNGVLCLVNDVRCEGTLIILWNPSIRKFVEVPQPKYVFEKYGGYTSVCGFGFDSTSNDYKVVRLVHLMDVDMFSKTMKVEVFSLKSGCWRSIGVCRNYRIKRANGYIPCFLNGYVHWVGSFRVGSYDDGTMKFENVILKFDVSLESFEVMEIPIVLKEGGYAPFIELYVQECDGMLALINRNFDDPRSCSIWLMEEYGVVTSWTKIYDWRKIYDFSAADFRDPFVMPRGFGFRKNGDLIMVKGETYPKEKNVIVSIDPITHGEMILRETTADDWSFYMSTYVESMALFKESKEKKIDSVKKIKRQRKRQEKRMILPCKSRILIPALHCRKAEKIHRKK